MRWSIVILLAAVVGCEELVAPTSTGPIAHFRTKLSKPDLETWEAAMCESGERQEFLGVDLKPSASGPVVRLVMDPLTGPALRVFDPADPTRSATYRKSDCKKFQVDLTETGVKVNDIRDYKLDLDVECEHGNGSLFAGTAKVEHCH